MEIFWKTHDRVFQLKLSTNPKAGRLMAATLHATRPRPIIAICRNPREGRANSAFPPRFLRRRRPSTNNLAKDFRLSIVE